MPACDATRASVAMVCTASGQTGAALRHCVPDSVVPEGQESVVLDVAGVQVKPGGHGAAGAAASAAGRGKAHKVPIKVLPAGHERVVDDVAAIGEGVEHIGAATAIGTTTVVANTALAISRSRRRNGPIAAPGLSNTLPVSIQLKLAETVGTLLV
jgi:hypothetical protein